MNQNYTIPAFAEPITDLPDTPTCEAAELKRRFQAPADEVREAHNALAEAHETLDKKVGSIIDQTFDGVIEKSMFSDALTAELDAKATQTAVADQIAAETAALSSRIDSVNSTAAQKCQLVIGTYIGNGSYPRTIYTGFTPKAVIIAPQATMYYSEYGTYGAVITQDGSDSRFSRIVSGGFELQSTGRPNYDGVAYYYLALR